MIKCLWNCDTWGQVHQVTILLCLNYILYVIKINIRSIAHVWSWELFIRKHDYYSNDPFQWKMRILNNSCAIYSMKNIYLKINIPFNFVRMKLMAHFHWHKKYFQQIFIVINLKFSYKKISRLYLQNIVILRRIRHWYSKYENKKGLISTILNSRWLLKSSNHVPPSFER